MELTTEWLFRREENGNEPKDEAPGGTNEEAGGYWKELAEFIGGNKKGRRCWGGVKQVDITGERDEWRQIGEFVCQ